MRRFHFRLERLLHLRESERQQQVVNLAELRRQLRDCERKLENARAEFEELQNSYRSAQAQKTSPEMLMTVQYALAVAQHSIDERAEAVHRAQDEVEAAREQLVAKSREVDIVQRLRRNQWEEFSISEGRREQGRIDATAVQQFALKSSTCSRAVPG
jgi:flagellar export protein FliJ